MIRTVGLFYIVLIFISCGHNEIDYSTIENQIQISNAKEVSVLDLVDDHYYLPLETNEKVQLHNITNIKFTKDLIFVFDQGHQGIFVFDFNGKFKYEFNLQGSGPGEYAQIDDFYLNEKGNYIDILDNTLNQINRYSFKGEFVKSTKIPFFSSLEIAQLGDGFIGVLRAKIGGSYNYPYECVVLDGGKVEGKYLKIRKNIDVFYSSPNKMFSVDGNVYVRPIYSPVIYKWTKEDLKPLYYFDFEGEWLSNKILKKQYLDPEVFMKKINQENQAAFFSYDIGREFLLFQYFKKEKTESQLYDLKRKALFKIKDFENSILRFSEYKYYHDGYFITHKEPSIIKKDSEDGVIGNKFLKKKLLDSLNPYGNPVLVFTKFKHI